MGRISAVLLLLLLSRCNNAPVPISYGEDICAYCGMIISDSRFGAELVTNKGKCFKFDSAECLVAEMRDKDESDYAHVLVTDFTNPSELIDALAAGFLVSESLPSPMGANLSAYESIDAATEMQKSRGGSIFDWMQIKDRF